MVNKSAIARNLREIDSRYNQSRRARDPTYYSKLALIELCGWIEITMDNIVMDCAKKHLNDASNLVFVEKVVVQRTNSFTYETHFRGMLMSVLGLVKVEELEGLLDPAKLDTMKSSLGTLKQRRDQEAHTYLAGTTPTLAAPSVIIDHFQKVYDGLKDVEKCVRRLRM